MAFQGLCGSNKLLNGEKFRSHTVSESLTKPIKHSLSLVQRFRVYEVWPFRYIWLGLDSLSWQMICTPSKFLKMEMVIEPGCGPLVNASLGCSNWWKSCATSASYFRRTFKDMGKRSNTICHHFLCVLITVNLFSNKNK